MRTGCSCGPFPTAGGAWRWVGVDRVWDRGSGQLCCRVCTSLPPQLHTPLLVAVPLNLFSPSVLSPSQAFLPLVVVPAALPPQARSAPMKRTPELGRLSGLRYAGALAAPASCAALLVGTLHPSRACCMQLRFWLFLSSCGSAWAESRHACALSSVELVLGSRFTLGAQPWRDSG